MDVNKRTVNVSITGMTYVVEKRKFKKKKIVLGQKEFTVIIICQCQIGFVKYVITLLILYCFSYLRVFGDMFHRSVVAAAGSGFSSEMARD